MIENPARTIAEAEAQSFTVLQYSRWVDFALAVSPNSVIIP